MNTPSTLHRTTVLLKIPFDSIRCRFEQLATLLFPGRRQLTAIRANWAQPGHKDDWLASRFFDLTRRDDDSNHVDDRTWNDLELPRIFIDIDTTITRLGSQYLYRLLRTPSGDRATSEFYETALVLRGDLALREALQLVLYHLDADSCATIVDGLFGAPLQNLQQRRLLVLWSAVSAVGLLGTLVIAWIPLLAILILAINITVITRVTTRVHFMMQALKSCHDMIRVADGLAKIRTSSTVPPLRALAEMKLARRKARRAFNGFAFFQNAPMGIGVWLNILCLAEWVAYILTVDRVATLRAELRNVYELVGAIDAAIALASFQERWPEHCRPEMRDALRIEIGAGCHPLLHGQTANSVALTERSALISGSNMSGKTTYIKMVATNLIFGRTLGLCLAARAVLPRASVMACIRGEHSIESGKSRFFVEMEALISFLRAAERREPLVVVLDEPFSGTNTIERIAAARSVLLALCRHCVVLATTHDVELQELLRAHFELFHFREDPDVEGFFDYRLRPGPCVEGNALRLLAKVGFPPSVVSDALGFLNRDE